MSYQHTLVLNAKLICKFHCLTIFFEELFLYEELIKGLLLFDLNLYGQYKIEQKMVLFKKDHFLHFVEVSILANKLMLWYSFPNEEYFIELRDLKPLHQPC